MARHDNRDSSTASNLAPKQFKLKSHALQKSWMLDDNLTLAWMRRSLSARRADFSGWLSPISTALSLMTTEAMEHLAIPR